MAAVNSGNIVVPLDRELPAADIEKLMLDCGADVFVHSNDYTDIAEYLQKGDVGIKHYINMKELPELSENGEQLIRYGDKRASDFLIDNNSLAAIVYTSGTTGQPKGVMLSHKSIALDAVASAENVEIVGNNILVLPLNHTFTLASVLVMMLYRSEICINSGLKNLMSDLEKFKPGTMILVPLFVETFYKKVWDTAKKQGKDGLLKKLIGFNNGLLKIGIDIRRKLFKSVIRSFGGNLKLIVTGGAPIDEKYIKGFRSFGISVQNGYGITECSPVVAVTRNEYYRDGSVGTILSKCEVKILNPGEDGNGEIGVKGDIVMLGYYNNEQATKEAFDGEWFKTGDIGYVDKDKFVFVNGRKKNLIILNNGKNVYPEDLEFSLCNIEYIKEAVVYAKDNTIVAEVFLDTENYPDCAKRLDSDIVRLNKTLAVYKNIGKTIIRDTEFPKTTTKKIKRTSVSGG